MTYCDIIFLGIFLPIVIIFYAIAPKKMKGLLLLIASYIFFWSISGKLIIFLLASTLITYCFGIANKKLNSKRDIKLKSCSKEEKKQIKEKYKKVLSKFLILAIAIQLGILIMLKYSYFIGVNLNSLFEMLNISFTLGIKKFIVPIGISFYTLQAISYMVDVNKELIKPVKNIGRVALFLSFFPQIMEGPICRYSETANSLWAGNKITYKNLTFGIQRIVYGLMKKMIIADRLDIIVSEIFNNYQQYNGGVSALGMVLYTLQLYMDFSGIMDMVIGIAQIFNVKLTENFKRPFLSKSISEFWTRWHISLGTWFRDYIYYPVSMNKLSKKLITKARKKMGNYYGPLLISVYALFCVWFCNGIWHGSAWSYIFFGMYHFILILLGRIFEPTSKKVLNKLKINASSTWYKIFQIIRTTILVFFGELFFRANGLLAGMSMFKKIFTNFSLKFDLYGMGLDKKDFLIVIVFTIIIGIVSIMQEKGINIREKIAGLKLYIKWPIYYIVIISVIIFGAYGVGYVPVSPMYAQF